VEPLAARRGAPELSRPTTADDRAHDAAARTEELFRRFREPVVRLVEQVTDELAPSLGPTADAQRDIRLVRATFGKWSAELLVALHAKPAVGFEELRRMLPGISARVLSIKLNELEQGGMVHREIIDARPPRVRYSLTDRGWTVAWLAQPILLYLRVTEPSPTRDAEGYLHASGAPPAPAPAGADAAAADEPNGRVDSPARVVARRSVAPGRSNTNGRGGRPPSASRARPRRA